MKRTRVPQPGTRVVWQRPRVPGTESGLKTALSAVHLPESPDSAGKSRSFRPKTRYYWSKQGFVNEKVSLNGRFRPGEEEVVG